MERGHETGALIRIGLGSLIALGVAVTVSALVMGISRPLLSASNDSEGAATDRPATIVQPLSCEKLPQAPGMAITTAIVTFPPRAFSPAHRHPGSVTAYVLKGVVRSQMAGSAAQTYHMGTTWFEPPGALHRFAENPSDRETAQLLAVFVAKENCGPLVIPERPPR